MPKICKKCGYERKEMESVSENECPKCGAIYEKVEARLKYEAVEILRQKEQKEKGSYQPVETVEKPLLVSMKNETGIIRQVKVGFSWTALFFGGFPFFFRGMPIQGIIWIVLALFTYGISNLVLMFIINKQTAHHYLENGYKPVGSGWDIARPQWGISISREDRKKNNRDKAKFKEIQIKYQNKKKLN